MHRQSHFDIGRDHFAKGQINSQDKAKDKDMEILRMCVRELVMRGSCVDTWQHWRGFALLLCCWFHCMHG